MTQVINLCYLFKKRFLDGHKEIFHLRDDIIRTQKAVSIHLIH